MSLQGSAPACALSGCLAELQRGSSTVRSRPCQKMLVLRPRMHAHLKALSGNRVAICQKRKPA